MKRSAPPVSDGDIIAPRPPPPNQSQSLLHINNDNDNVTLKIPTNINTDITYCTSNNFGSHPLGVQPEGNRYLSDIESIREGGLGYLAHFDDQFIIDNILSYCDPQTLLNLEQTSKAMYALIVGSDVELWKEPCVEISQGDFIFQWRWRLTYITEYQLRHNVKYPIIQEKYVNMYNKYNDIEKLEAFIENERLLYQQEEEEKYKQLALKFEQDEENVINIITKNKSDDDSTNDNNSSFIQHGPSTFQTTTSIPFNISPYPTSSQYTQRPVKPIHPQPLRFATTYPPQLLHIFPTRESSLPPINCRGFYSDTLFQPWNTILQYHLLRDMWKIERNISRVDINTITVDEFEEKYGKPGKPVVITGITNDWDAVVKNDWDLDHLLHKNYSSLRFKYICGIAMLTMDKYLLYASRCDDDDTPIYLFDKTFGETNPYILQQYNYPKHFSKCYFQQYCQKPPPFRWFLIGPQRSSSSFHQDPLSTCAQNMLTQGLKKWVMYPPHITPPGIIASTDKLQVTAPFNSIEWYINFYKYCKAKDYINKPEFDDINNNDKTNNVDADDNVNNNNNPAIIKYDHITDYPKQCSHYSQYRPVEVIQRPGECVYVPSTWWHTVINFDYGVAVTQNQLTSSSLLACEQLLTKIGQPTLRQEVLDGVEGEYPGLYQRLKDEQHSKFQLLQQYHQFKKNQQNQQKGNPPSNDKKVTVEVKRELISMFNRAKTCNNTTTMNCDGDDTTKATTNSVIDKKANNNNIAFSFDFDE